MTGPYRSGKAAPLVVSDSGLVDEVVRQFADRYACFRELVQNAIDAGTPSVDVRLSFRDGLVRVSVRDEGEGMDRDVLEHRLVVLFRSTKEGREDAIGKFGIGFVSVLALEPTLVTVHTSRGRGEAFVLQLHPDRTYDLFSTDGGESSFTTVTLEVPCDASAIDVFIDEARASLEKWCKHATIPVHFLAHVEGESEPRCDERIDRPLDLPGALVSVPFESPDGKTQAVVGLVEAPYAGFFNRGLTLYETADRGPVGFKVQDPRLEHTLSRDNVQRDAAYHRVTRLVDGEGRQLLHRAIATALREAAESDRDRHLRIARIAYEHLRLDPADCAVPLVDAVDGRTWATIAEARDPVVFHAAESTPLTRALASGGRRVVVSACASLLRDVGGRLSVFDPHDSLTLVQPVPLETSDWSLFGHLTELLSTAHRRPSDVVVAELTGQCADALFIANAKSTSPWIVQAVDADADPFRLLLRPALVLSAAHPIVDKARRATDPVLAAALLARAILLDARVLTGERDEALFSAALARLGVVA